jgi:hypothetical protein
MTTISKGFVPPTTAPPRQTVRDVVVATIQTVLAQFENKKDKPFAQQGTSIL